MNMATLIPAAPDSQRPMASARGRWPLLVGYVLGFSSTIALPIWLGLAGERFDLSPGRMGILGTLELGSVALASLLSALLRGAGTRHGFLYAAVVISFAGNLVSAFASSVEAFVVARVAVALSHGYMLATVTRRAALRADAQQVFAAQQFAVVIFAVAFFASAAPLLPYVGPGEPFLFLACLVLLMACVLPLLETSPAAALATSEENRVPVVRLAVAAAFASLAITFCLQAAFWSNLALYASGVGLSIERLSVLLAVGAVANMLAPLASSRLAVRTGPTLPLIGGFAVMGLSAWGLGFATGVVSFAACTIMLTTAQIFLVPWLLGSLVELDHSGRAAAAGPAFFTIGSALGPVCGGAIIASQGPRFLSVLGLVAAMAALLLVLLSGWRAASLPASVPSAHDPVAAGPLD